MRAVHSAAWWTWRLPTTRAGRWAVALFGVAVVAVLFMGAALVIDGQGATFDRSPVLGAPAAVAAFSGFISAALGGYAIVRHERALLVFLTTAIGLNVLAYALGEAVRPG